MAPSMPHRPALGPLACVLAAAGLSSAAAAQQVTVTLYGALDAYVGVQSGSGIASRKVVNSSFNPNSLGFAGHEPLGGGYSAGFVLEGQPGLDTGTNGQGGKFFGRQTNVYLSGGFGRLTLGRVHLPGRTFGIKYSATGWLTTDPLGNMAIATGSALAPVMNIDSVGSRVSNAVMYSSPRVGGASATLVQSVGEGGLFSAGNAKITQLGLGYSHGPLALDAVYNRIPAIAGSQIAQTDFSIGAQYAVGGFRVMGSFFSRSGWSVAAPGSTTVIAGSKGSDRTYVVGGSYTTGPHTVGVAVGRADVAAVHRGRRPANMSAPFSTVVDDLTGFSLAYTHGLSKRTQLFAAYGTLDNNGVGTASITPDLRPTAGGRSSLMAAGIRHSF